MLKSIVNDSSTHVTDLGVVNAVVNNSTSKYYTTVQRNTSWEVVNNKKTNNRVFLPYLCQLVIDKLIFVPENKLN